MGGRGNNRNNSNSFYNSINNGGRNTSYDSRSQPAHTPQSTSNNYPLGRGTGNFQSHPPYWQNSFSHAGGFPRPPPPWGRQNANNVPPWGRNNYRPQHPLAWEQNQQHRFPNPQGPWISGAPSPLLTTLSTSPDPISTPRFVPLSGSMPPPPPPPLIFTANSGSNLMKSNLDALTTAPEDSNKSTTSVVNPPLGSKEDRELRLEVAKTLLKKSLEESKGEETGKVTTVLTSLSPAPPAGQQKKKVSKPRFSKPNEGDNKQSSCFPVDQVSIDHNVNKSSSAAPVTEEQRKRRVSLESNCIPSADASKSSSKPTTPKRNRSNSLSISAIPKTPEISTSSAAQNIKQRIIHELLGMSKNTLNEIISNPRSRKFEYVMKYMMKESRWKQSQIQRQVAQAGMDSSSESSNCEFVQRDYEDLLSDPDLAINLSNLPSEIIETLGNIFNLGSVCGAQYETSGGINLDSDDISCLFDSNSPSYVKSIPFVDLSPPAVHNLPEANINRDDEGDVSFDDLPYKSEKLSYDDHTEIVPEEIDHNVKVGITPNMPIEDFTKIEEPSQKLKSPEDLSSSDSFMGKNARFTPVAISLIDEHGKTIHQEIPVEIESSEEAVLRLSRPEIDNFSMSMDEDDINSMEDTTNELHDSTNNLQNLNLHLEEKNRSSPNFTSDSRNEEDKEVESQEQSPEEETALSDLDPMFSTQSDSPTIDEELASCSSQAKKDLENIVDADDDGFNTNQLAMDGPLMSPDSFNGAIINNNEMMTMKSIDTVESDESLHFFGNSIKETGQCNQACMADSDEVRPISNPQDMECPPDKSLGTSSEKVNQNEITTVCVTDTCQPCTSDSDEGEPESKAQDIKCPPDEGLGTSFKNVNENETSIFLSNDSSRRISLQLKDRIGEPETKETQFVSNQHESHSYKPDIEIKREKEAPLELREQIALSKSLTGVEIGIQTDHSGDDPVYIAANDMNSIFKLLESSALPGIDQVKKLLGYPSCKSSVDQLQENSFTITDKPESCRLTRGKSTPVASDSLECPVSSLSVEPRDKKPIPAKSNNSRTCKETPALPISCIFLDSQISVPPLVRNSQSPSADRQSKSKRQIEEKRVPLAAVDSDCPASTAGILKGLQAQIKGLEPKDKLKYVFLKITDIEKKIAMWADIKKELYQLVSYILEDEKSQSASSSHEESVVSEVEPEPSNNSTRYSSAKKSLPCPTQIRASRSGALRTLSTKPVHKPVESNSECDSLSKFPSKIVPKRKRKQVRLTSHGRKKKKNCKEKLSTPEAATVENEFVSPGNEASRPKRSVTRIKVESESDISEENIIVGTSVGERSRSSKRYRAENPVLSSFSDSSPTPDLSRKRTCTRQSASSLETSPVPSIISSPLRKTKAELKQMVFFPKPPERRTRRSSVSKTLNEDTELRVTRTLRGKHIVAVKEESPEIFPESPESARVPLRSCRVVLHQLDRSALQPKETSDDELAVETHSVYSSDEDDELPLSLLSRKESVVSPSVSSQEDIDISSVSSSDTASLKLHIACPKSMKKTRGDQVEEQHRQRHHSSKHGPLLFAQHNLGAILDIKVVGKHVLAASEDGIVLSYSVKSGKIKKKYRGHSAAVTCICIINSESEPFYPEKMVTGSKDGQLRCFILKTGEQVHAPLQVGETSAIDADWGLVYLGTNKGEVAQVNAKTFTTVGDIFECSQEAIHALKATKEGPRKVLIVGSRNQAITVRDADTGLLLRSVSGGWQYTVYSLLLDNSLVYCGTKEGSVPAFDFTNGQQMFRLQAGNGVRCLKAYNGLLFAGCYDGFIYVFKGQTLVTKFAGGKMIISMDFTKNKVIFSSKDKLQALNFPLEVSLLLKESKIKKVKCLDQ